MLMPVPGEYGSLERQPDPASELKVLRRYTDPFCEVLVGRTSRGNLDWESFFLRYRDEFSFNILGDSPPFLSAPQYLPGRSLSGFRFSQKAAGEIVLDSYLSIGLSIEDKVVSIASSLIYRGRFTPLSAAEEEFLLSLQALHVAALLSKEGLILAEEGIGRDPESTAIDEGWSWGSVPGAMGDMFEPVRVVRAVVLQGSTTHTFEIRVAVRQGKFEINRIVRLTGFTGIDVKIFYGDPLTANCCLPLTGAWGDLSPKVKAEFGGLRKPAVISGLTDGMTGLSSPVCFVSKEATAIVKLLKIRDLAGDVYAFEQSILMSFYWIEAFHDFMKNLYGWSFAAKPIALDPCFELGSSFDPSTQSANGGLIRLGGFGKASMRRSDQIPDALDAAVIIHELVHLILYNRDFKGGCDLVEGCADVIARMFLDQFDCRGCAGYNAVFRFEHDVPRDLVARRDYTNFVRLTGTGGHNHGSYWCEAVWRIFVETSASEGGRAKTAAMTMIALLDAANVYVPPNDAISDCPLGTPVGNYAALKGQEAFAGFLLTALARNGMSRAGLDAIKKEFKLMNLKIRY